MLDTFPSKDAVDATLDHAKDYHLFSMEILAWAIQGTISVPCIERYLRKQSTSTLHFELEVHLVDKSGLSTYPILFFVVERNSPELISILATLGASIQDRSLPSDLPILAYTVISAEYEVSDTTQTMIALLAEGANPYELPVEMWEDYLKSPSRLETTPVNEPCNPPGWCTLELQDALCRNLNLLQRYSLWKSTKFPNPAPRKRQLGKETGTTALFGIPYHIIGQHPATRDVLQSVTSHILLRRSKPLVLLFAGPSGHGKTELALRMGDLLSLESVTVDCTEMEHETDMFGPKAPYHGYDKGSPLNNHLAKWAGQRSVVFLDEFDKTKEEVRKGLLLLFQSGDYRDRRDKKWLDCSKTIWILATNHGEESINRFWVDHLTDRTEEEQTDAPFNDLSMTLKASFALAIGAPLIGRVTRIISFFPFTTGEQAVVTFKFMRDLRTSVREPINVEAKNFAGHMHLNFVDDGKIASCLAKDFYMPELGARSLETAVDCHVEQKLVEEFMNQPGRVVNEINSGPLVKYDVRVSTTSHVFEEVTVKQVGLTSLLSQKEDADGDEKGMQGN